MVVANEYSKYDEERNLYLLRAYHHWVQIDFFNVNLHESCLLGIDYAVKVQFDCWIIICFNAAIETDEPGITASMTLSKICTYSVHSITGFL
jgi:hypothetical protein